MTTITEEEQNKTPPNGPQYLPQPEQGTLKQSDLSRAGSGTLRSKVEVSEVKRSQSGTLTQLVLINVFNSKNVAYLDS